MKIKVSAKKEVVSVTIKSTSNERLDINAVNIINMGVKGFAPLRINNDNSGKFIVNSELRGFTTLKDYIKKPVNKMMFKSLIESSFSIMSDIDNNQLQYSNVILELDKVLVNRIDGQVLFIYYPAIGYNNGKYFNSFLEEIIKNMKANKREDTSYLNELNMMISNPATMSWNRLKQYVTGLNGTPDYGMSYGRASIPAVQSNSQSDERETAIVGVDDLPVNGVMCQSCGNLNTAPGARYCVKCGSLLPANDALQAQQQGMASYSFIQSSPPMGNDYVINTNYSYENEDDLNTSILQYTFDEDEEMATTLLNNEPEKIKPIAKLVQKKSGDSIEISNNSFSIGKSTKCDYTIVNNTTVSRHHATIVYRDDKYYIFDNNSTNGTLVDGVKVEPQGQYELKDGCEITLSDEEFIISIT